MGLSVNRYERIVRFLCVPSVHMTGRLKNRRHNDNGDRESEAVFIGVYLDKKKILSALQAALLTDAEFEGGVEAWREWPDPFFGGDLFDLSQEDEDGDVMICAMEEKVDEIETSASKGRMNGHKRKAGADAKAAKKDGKKGKEQKKKKA